MGAPVRMVCGGCLRSVEVSPGLAGETSNLCPYCGRDIDSRQDNAETQTAMTQGLEGMLEAEPSASDSSLGWTKTWSRGSLGSLGRFQLRDRLGDGGFGQVFLAFDPRLDRDVALKVLKQANPNERVMERFFREARAAARLDHPNIVAVHDAGFENGRCWVAFHFVSGRPLNWYRDQHRLDPPTAARILRDLADAVDHAHRQGVLHRDIKPANVLIDDLGRPRLIDFGLARRSDLDSSLTHDGAVIGTPAYMSPEQALGFSSRVDERSDVFSLGVIFFEVLSGERPYSAASRSGPSLEAAEPPSSPGICLRRRRSGQFNRPFPQPWTGSACVRSPRTRATGTPRPERWPTTLTSGCSSTGEERSGSRSPSRPSSWDWRPPCSWSLVSALCWLPGMTERDRLRAQPGWEPVRLRVRLCRAIAISPGCCSVVLHRSSSSATPARALPSFDVSRHPVHEPVEQGRAQGR